MGNGTSIRIWHDNWIPRPFSYKTISAQGRCRVWFVSELLTENGSWNIGLLNEHFVAADVQEILKTKPLLGWRMTQLHEVQGSMVFSLLNLHTRWPLMNHREEMRSH